MSKTFLYWNSTKIMHILLVIPLILLIGIIPVMAEHMPEKIPPSISEVVESKITIKGKPTEPIECTTINERCEPNKRMIIYAIYDKETVRDKGNQLRDLLINQQTLKNPRVIESPITKSDDGRYETVYTSFEFVNGEISKIDDIKFRMGSDKLFSDAAFIRVTTFNTWHNFGEGQERPCELIDVIEFGDSNLIINP